MVGLGQFQIIKVVFAFSLLGAADDAALSAVLCSFALFADHFVAGAAASAFCGSSVLPTGF